MRTGIALVTLSGLAVVVLLNRLARVPEPPKTPAPTTTTFEAQPGTAPSSEAMPTCSGQASGKRDGAWDVQSVPLRDGASWVIAATGGEGPGDAHEANNGSNGDGSLLVQREEGGAFEKLAIPSALYTRLAAGQTGDGQVHIVAASAQGLEWLRVNTADLQVAAPVSLPAPGPGSFTCNNTLPTSVAMVESGCDEGLLVAVSYYSRKDYWCGGVRLFSLEGERAELVRTVDTGQGISKARFFDANSDGKLDLVTSRRMIDRASGTWGDVWSVPHDQCVSDAAAPTSSLAASYLAKADGCALAVADFDVAVLNQSSGDARDVYFAAGFTAHEFPSAENCWNAATHGGYAMVTNANGEFVAAPRRLDKYERSTGPQLMAHAIGFQSQPQPGSVQVATGYFKGSGGKPESCISTQPCPGPALLETFPLQPACEEQQAAFAAPPCETWLGFCQRLDVSGLRNETLVPAYALSCAPEADGVGLPGVSIAHVVSVVSGDEANLRKRPLASDARVEAQGFSFWRAASWVALERKIAECVRVDYLVAQSPSVWAANVQNKEPQRLTQ